MKNENQGGNERFMTTRITQVDDRDRRKTILRVEGSLHIEDAELLERTYMNLRAEQELGVTIDLADISFLDSESASVLCRLRQQGVELSGLHFFIRRVIELAEKSATS
jgi:anti-anti-sigma regulatory factor